MATSAPPFTPEQVATMWSRLREDFQPRDARIDLMKALVYDVHKDDGNDALLGTMLPSTLLDEPIIIKFRDPTLLYNFNFLTSILTQNKPIVEVNRVITAEPATQKAVVAVEDELEQFLNAILEQAFDRNPRLRESVAAYQSLQGCAWWEILPADVMLGLPDRKFKEDLTKEELEELASTGDLIDTRDPSDQTIKPAESADALANRRDEVMRNRALSGRSLFHFRAIPHQSVYYENDADGLSLAIVAEQVQASAFHPNSSLAAAAARYHEQEDFERLGIAFDDDGKIMAGLPEGTPAGSAKAASHSRPAFTILKVYTRNSYSYWVTGQTTTAGGGHPALIWASPHKRGVIPLYPAAGHITGETTPENEYLPLLLAASPLLPLINQVVTFLSSSVIRDSTPRYLVRLESGELLTDKSGAPTVISHEETIGGDPEVLDIMPDGAALEKLDVGNADQLLAIYQVFQQKLDLVRLSPAETGSGEGQADTAWGARIAQEAAAREYAPAIRHNTEALRAGLTDIVEKDIRSLGPATLYIVGAPLTKDGKPKKDPLIKLDAGKVPFANLTVHQSTLSAEARALNEAHGLTLLREHLIDEREFYEKYKLDPNPNAAIIRAKVGLLANAALVGPGDPAKGGLDPSSILYQLVGAVKGEGVDVLVKESPMFVDAMAEFMLLVLQQLGQPPGGVSPEGANDGAPPDPVNPVAGGPPTRHEGADDFIRGLGNDLNEAMGARGAGFGAPQQQPPLTPLEQLSPQARGG